MKLKILIIRLILSQFRIFHLPLSKELLLGKLVLIYIEIIIQKIVKKNKKKMINNLKTTQNPTSRCLVSAASNTPWIFTTNVKFSLSRNPQMLQGRHKLSSKNANIEAAPSPPISYVTVTYAQKPHPAKIQKKRQKMIKKDISSGRINSIFGTDAGNHSVGSISSLSISLIVITLLKRKLS